MQYKALFIDLDGTTVGYKQILPSKRVIEAVKKANQKLTVSIATGRILAHTLPIIDVLGIRGLCVLDQGTQLYDPQKQEMVQELLLASHSIEKVIPIFMKHSLPTYIFDGKENIPYSKDVPLSHVVSVFAEDFPVGREYQLMKDLSDVHHVSVHRMVGKTSELLSIEVTHPLGTKQHGIEEVAKRLGIDTKEIIGVGDGYNDFPLLLACGLKIAMENAVPELKDVADFIAPSVDEDGVAVVIEKFILN